VPLKVLLADDNITAQRMGSKILSEAGYTVVPVSNGAAAVKKIASEKPELIILDVYMPGYTGLEVCDKVKSAAETARVPVLLTITSMEPFSPEDGNRVKADGVLIKPFVPTDLLAVVRKLEGKMQAAVVIDTGSKLGEIEEFAEHGYAEWKVQVGLTDAPAKAPEFSHEVASAPVLGIDALSDAPPVALESFPSPVVVENRPAEEAVLDPNAPEPAFDLQHVEPRAESAIAPPPELEFTSSPSSPAPQIQPAAEFEPTMQSAGEELPVTQEPALATDPSDFAQFATKFGQENPEDIPVGIAMETEQEEEAIADINDLVGETVATADASVEQELSVAPESTMEPEEMQAIVAVEPEMHLQTQVHEIATVEPETHLETETHEIATVEPEIHLEPEVHDAGSIEPEVPFETVMQEAATVEPEPELREAAVAEPEVHFEAVMQESATVEPEPELREAAVAEPEVHFETVMQEAATVEPELEVAAIAEPEVHFEPVAPQAAMVEHEIRQAVEALATGAAAALAPARETEPQREVGMDTQPLEPFREPELPPPMSLEVAPPPPAATYDDTQQLEPEFIAEMQAAQLPANAEPLSDAQLLATAEPAIAMDEQHVAAAVDRVLQRYKDVLIAAIVRELKS